MEKLLILHGALGSKSQFEALISSFSNQLDVYFLEFSGHGIQKFRKDFSVPQFSNELSQFIQTNSLLGCHVFGYSMGGYVALYNALSHPEHFRSLQTLATKFSWNPDIAEKEIKMLDPDRIVEKIPAFAEVLDKRHGNWRKLMESTQDLMKQLGENPLLDTSNLPTLQIPVKIMRGSLDTMVSEEESKWAVENLNKARYIEIPEAKHPIEKYDPASLAALIERNLLDV
ncbi:alpha/beta hydrolase [Marivirga sp. S37H4]|uniref:Alpha/beta hydrolase n=1 Tax=Marivirga aurantiaca TaxID=2802615 RepID=A0A934X1G7_9BACT|nr:alpha/beta hydrolase [Marivirga aurantiaca]MBK6266747.1 alpha/beta hydrolase [Marivirga aurantiaca]